MAIEFHCPYCTATVRVDNAAAGKVGRCPKCETRLRVPTFDQMTGQDRSVPAPVGRHEPDAPAPFSHVPSEGEPSIARSLPSPAAAPIPLPAVPGFPAINTDDRTGSVTKYLRTKKKESHYGALIPPLIFLWIFLVIAAVYWWWSLPKYHGTLAGERLNPQQSIQADIRPERFTIPRPLFESLVTEFRESPSDLRSNLVNLRFSGGPNGVSVNLRPGSEADLVRVPVLEMPAVAKHYRDREHAWDDLRQAEMQAALERMSRVWLALDDSAQGTSLPEYREEVAYNAFVRGLGRLCEAVVMSGGQAVKYPCVHEDGEGNLYFLVPVRTKEFSIARRSDLQVVDGLPQSFKIRVTVKESPGPTFNLEQGSPKGDVTTPVEVVPFGTDPPPAPSAEPETTPATEPSPTTDSPSSN